MTATIHRFPIRARLDPACLDMRIITDPTQTISARVRACDRLLARHGLRAAVYVQARSERHRLTAQAKRDVRAAVCRGDQA